MPFVDFKHKGLLYYICLFFKASLFVIQNCICTAFQHIVISEKLSTKCVLITVAMSNQNKKTPIDY
jgi:hypothetical protein